MTIITVFVGYMYMQNVKADVREEYIEKDTNNFNMLNKTLFVGGIGGKVKIKFEGASTPRREGNTRIGIRERAM